MTTIQSLSEFDATVAEIGSRTPGPEDYLRLTTVVLDHPSAPALAALDPFSAEYRAAALDIYVSLRGREADSAYVPERDEAALAPLQSNVWTGVVPWGFQDPALGADFLMAWGHICRMLGVKAGQSVLEYGPGSGQVLLLLARMGVRAYGVDVNLSALRDIRHQSNALGVTVDLEVGRFGDGFGEQRFDAILFFEAFHHALDFSELLRRLRDRLEPGGRLVLCGEPIVEAPTPSIPYPWGPRLDALSVLCMRRFGWMELGFSHDFFVDAARRCGWSVARFTFSGCERASGYVLEPVVAFDVAETNAVQRIGPFQAPSTVIAVQGAEGMPVDDGSSNFDQYRRELAAIKTSTSWRVTAPIRALGYMLRRPG